MTQSATHQTALAPQQRRIEAPPLRHVLGAGFLLWGQRNPDPDSGSWIWTHGIGFLGIPLLACGAYRIRDEGKQRTFVERVRLSGGWRVWNAFLVLAFIACVAFLLQRTLADSPEQNASRQLEEGDRLAERGDIVPAARLYRDVAAGQSEAAGRATDRFHSLFGLPLENVSLADVAEVFRIALSWPRESDLRDGLAHRGLELLSKRGPSDASAAVTLLDLVAPFASDRTGFLRERRQLLERWHALAADNLDLVVALAQTYDQLNDSAETDRLLTPYEPRLGTGEGARILGKVRLRQGRNDSGIALLGSYVDRHLPPLRQAVCALQDARQDLAERIRRGTAEEFPYHRYEKANGEERLQIEWHYLRVLAGDDATLRTTLQALTSYERVRPAVLDLGQAHLGRARPMADTADRDRETAKAEELFLAVREIDGDRSDPRLKQAQVKFWIGRDADGRRLVEDLLAAEDRSYDALLRASHLLRDIGAADDARKLLEEAYQKETAIVHRHRAAELRALLPVDLEDRLRWLERADPASSNVTGLLHTTRGYLARERSQDQEATEHLQKAVALYDSLSRSPATLNNGGLACLALYTVNGDRATLDKGVAMLEQAITLHPGDTVLLSNALDGVLDVALQDVLGKDLALDAMRSRRRGEFLSFLYADRAGRDRLTEQLRSHAGFTKARGLAEKLILLAPRQTAGYSALYTIHLATRDVDGLRRLDSQLANANVDLAAQLRAQRDRLEGRADTRAKEELTASTERLEKRCDQFGDRTRVMTYAVPRTLLARSLMQRTEFGLEVDADRIVALAEQAHSALPSRLTRQTLASALFFRSHRKLIALDKPYTELASRTARSLDAGTTLAVALDRDASMKARLAQDRDYRRGCELLRENSLAFPDELSPWAEKLLRPVYPEEADRIAAALKNDEIGQDMRSIALRLGPWNLPIALEQSWFLRRTGKEEEAKAVLRRAAVGVPLPFQATSPP